MKTKFFPSLLGANFGALQKEIDAVESFVDGFHFDVMDGHFVPNISAGAPVLRCLKSAKPFDAHLMIENPEKYIADFASAGAAMISVHVETAKDAAAVLGQIKELGAKAGLVFNPDTAVEPYLADLAEADFALVMSVYPGFGGQEFMADILEKVGILRDHFPEMPIQIDGGINTETAKKAIAAGANWLVSGSYFWGSADREGVAMGMRGE